jgi:hypothetical protein
MEVTDIELNHEVRLRNGEQVRVDDNLRKRKMRSVVFNDGTRKDISRCRFFEVLVGGAWEPVTFPPKIAAECQAYFALKALAPVERIQPVVGPWEDPAETET